MGSTGFPSLSLARRWVIPPDNPILDAGSSRFSRGYVMVRVTRPRKFGSVRALIYNQETKSTGNPVTGAMHLCPGKFAPIRTRFGGYFGDCNKLVPISL
jgi:hypothetical protein